MQSSVFSSTMSFGVQLVFSGFMARVWGFRVYTKFMWLPVCRFCTTCAILHKLSKHDLSTGLWFHFIYWCLWPTCEARFSQEDLQRNVQDHSDRDTLYHAGLSWKPGDSLPCKHLFGERTSHGWRAWATELQLQVAWSPGRPEDVWAHVWRASMPTLWPVWPGRNGTLLQRNSSFDVFCGLGFQQKEKHIQKPSLVHHGSPNFLRTAWQHCWVKRNPRHEISKRNEKTQKYLGKVIAGQRLCQGMSTRWGVSLKYFKDWWWPTSLWRQYVAWPKESQRFIELCHSSAIWNSSNIFSTYLIQVSTKTSSSHQNHAMRDHAVLLAQLLSQW